LLGRKILQKQALARSSWKDSLTYLAARGAMRAGTTPFLLLWCLGHRLGHCSSWPIGAEGRRNGRGRKWGLNVGALRSYDKDWFL
jgi:hypothetical protein